MIEDIEETKDQVQGLFQYLYAFLRNPLEEIKSLPVIKWRTLLIFQFCLIFVSVVVSNLLAPYAINLTNMLISLVASAIAISLVSLFFYYFFLIIYNQRLPFIKIFTLILFAHIPFALFHLAAYFFPPSDLIGLGISALLMIVGLVENFHIPRKLAIRLMSALYLIFFLYWAVHLITMRNLSQSSAPQDLDQIERELNQ